MTREAAVAVMLGVAVVILGVLAVAWWLRFRRDRGMMPPSAPLPADARVLGEFPALYVATTRPGEPLERLAIRGLAYRSRAVVTVTDAGIAVALTGQPDIAIAAADIDDVAQATVAIDRVVEPDGLTRVRWRIDPATPVDSYFRPQDHSARALTEAIRSILTTPTGADS